MRRTWWGGWGLALIQASAVWACPLCKDLLTSEGPGTKLAQGYTWSILLLMSAPYLLVASIAGLIVWSSRRKAHHAPGGT